MNITKDNLIVADVTKPIWTIDATMGNTAKFTFVNKPNVTKIPDSNTVVTFLKNTLDPMITFAKLYSLLVNASMPVPMSELNIKFNDDKNNSFGKIFKNYVIMYYIAVRVNYSTTSSFQLMFLSFLLQKSSDMFVNTPWSNGDLLDFVSFIM